MIDSTWFKLMPSNCSCVKRGEEDIKQGFRVMRTTEEWGWPQGLAMHTAVGVSGAERGRRQTASIRMRIVLSLTRFA